jgi:hypothetical protein
MRLFVVTSFAAPHLALVLAADHPHTPATAARVAFARTVGVHHHGWHRRITSSVSHPVERGALALVPLCHNRRGSGRGFTRRFIFSLPTKRMLSRPLDRHHKIDRSPAPATSGRRHASIQRRRSQLRAWLVHRPVAPEATGLHLQTEQSQPVTQPPVGDELTFWQDQRRINPPQPQAL